MTYNVLQLFLKVNSQHVEITLLNNHLLISYPRPLRRRALFRSPEKLAVRACSALDVEIGIRRARRRGHGNRIASWSAGPGSAFSSAVRARIGPEQIPVAQTGLAGRVLHTMLYYTMLIILYYTILCYTKLYCNVT